MRRRETIAPELACRAVRPSRYLRLVHVAPASSLGPRVICSSPPRPYIDMPRFKSLTLRRTMCEHVLRNPCRRALTLALLLAGGALLDSLHSVQAGLHHSCGWQPLPSASGPSPALPLAAAAAAGACVEFETDVDSDCTKCSADGSKCVECQETWALTAAGACIKVRDEQPLLAGRR